MSKIIPAYVKTVDDKRLNDKEIDSLIKHINSQPRVKRRDCGKMSIRR